MKILLIFCGVTFWLILTFKLDKLPPGLLGDEASIGYNAVLLSQRLRDENNRLLPIFILTLGQKDWKQPITIYSTALLFKIIGPSVFNLRLVSVIFAVVSAGLFFVLVKQLFSSQIALVGLALFLTTPIIFIQSHLALENIAPVPFILLWLIFLYRYLQQKRNLLLLFAGISLGVSLFSYNGMRLIAPMMYLLTVGYLIYLKKSQKWSIKEAKPVIILSAAFLSFLIILFLLKAFYPGALFGNNRPEGIASYQRFFRPYLATFDPTFLFITGDTTPYHSTGKHGIFLLASLPLFVWGIIRVHRANSSFFYFVLAVFFFSPLGYGLVDSIHRGSRLLALVVPYLLIVTLGVKEVLSLSNTKIRTGMLSILLVLAGLNFGDFANEYWFKYGDRIRGEFPLPAQFAVEDLKKQAQVLSLQPFIEYGVYQFNRASFDFLELSLFGQHLPKLKDVNTTQPIPNSIVLARVKQDFLTDKIKVATVSSRSPDYQLYLFKDDNQ